MSTNKPSKGEDEFFAREEADILKKQRLQAQEAAAAAARQLHFMKCPKDGNDLVNEDFHGVTVDRCVHCHGIFLDADEIATVVAHEDPNLLGRVFRDMAAALRTRKSESK